MSDYSQRYGRWALVLGGSEGLGRAIAMELAARGMNIALAARRQGPLDATAALLRDTHGVETKTMTIDLAKGDVIEAIEAGMAGEEIGFLVFNAAAEPYGEFLDLDIDEHLTNIAVNVTAVTRVAHHVGRAMKARGRGGLVLCSSLAAGAGLYTWVSYGAAKSYDNILGEGLWYELRQYGVDACTLMIGTTWTESLQRTQKRLGGVFAETRTPDNLPAGMTIPQLPEEAAANLFAQCDGEWAPVVFANPEDKPRWDGLVSAPRAAIIGMAAEAQKAWYS